MFCLAYFLNFLLPIEKLRRQRVTRCGDMGSERRDSERSVAGKGEKEKEMLDQKKGSRESKEKRWIEGRNRVIGRKEDGQRDED